jgi:uncharacterized membrane protein
VVASLLAVGTYGAVVLFVLGLVAMLVAGIGPLDVAPPFDPGRLLADVAVARPAALVWLGVVVIVITPTARVITALIGFARSGEWVLVAVAAAILGVIASSVLVAILAEA